MKRTIQNSNEIKDNQAIAWVLRRYCTNKRMQRIKQYTLLCFAMLLGSSNLISQVTCTVSGAGSSDVNGEYIWDCSTLNGDENPLYEHVDGDYYLHSSSSGLWVITEDDYWPDQYSSYYYSDAGYDGSTHIPPVENWQVQDGSAPEPTITVSASFTVTDAGDGYLNGVYTYDGTTNNDENPVYQLEDEYYYLHANSNGVWVINDDSYYAEDYNSYYYKDVGYDGSTSIPPPDDWEQQNGASPSPSVACGVVAPPCPDFDITLTTQAEVDNFIITYPNCTNPNNTITINGSDITNLNGLGNIEVAFTLDIISAPSLTSLSGLANFEGFGTDGTFKIENTGISNLSGLTSMTQSMYYFSIRNNPNLTSLAGGASDLFTLVDERLIITGNPALTSLSGLNPSSAVNNPELQITIGDNQALEELGNLDKFITIENLYIYENPLLTNLNGLENLTSITGDLNVGGITTLNGLDNLTSVGAGVSLINHSGITDLSDLTSLTSIGGLHLNNTVLTSLNGLGLITFTGFLQFTGNSNLTDISALADVELDISSLNISSNSSLSSCAINSICDLLDDNTVSKTISNNATNCNSIAEVDAICNPVCGPDSELPTAAGTYTGAEVTVDADGFSYYCDGNGKLLLAIKVPGGWTIPADAVQLKIGATTAEYFSQSCGATGGDACFVQNAAGTGIINRHWEIDESKVTYGAFAFVEVKHFFTNTEFNALNTTLTNNGVPALSAVTEMELYNVNPFQVSNMFPAVADVKPFYSAFVLKNGATPVGLNWVYAMHGMSDHSATFKIASSLFKAGGGLGGKIK